MAKSCEDDVPTKHETVEIRSTEVWQKLHSVQEGNLKIEELGNRAIWKSETYLNYEHYKFGFFSVNIYMSAAVVLHVSSTETGPTALPCIMCAREYTQLRCMTSGSPSLPHSRKYLGDKRIEKGTIRNSL